MSKLFTENYPYENALQFMQDEEKMEQIVLGCIAAHLDTMEFEEFALQSIKDYAGEVGIGYPKENEESIEESFQEYEILDLMKTYILSELGIANRY